MSTAVLAVLIAAFGVLAWFVTNGQRRHGRLISLPRRYTQGFQPRHAKPAELEGSRLGDRTEEWGMAA